MAIKPSIKLHYMLNQVKKVQNIDSLLKQKQDKKEVKKYFRVNRIAYRLFHNLAGYEHCGISRNHKFKREDLVVGLKDIHRYMKSKNAKKVLELASGLGPNSYYLAKNNPQVHFDCLDLCTDPIKKYKSLSNITFRKGDYHNLSRYPNSSFDIVFIIEALCFSNRKALFLKEVHKKLKPGGRLIIFDAYRGKNKKELTKEQNEILTLAVKGMSVNEFELVSHFDETVRRFKGFKLIKREDLSECVIPTIKRFQHLAKVYLAFPFLIRALKPFFPYEFNKNVFPGYFLAPLVETRLFVYYKHVLEKI